MYPHTHFLTALTLAEIAVDHSLLTHEQAVLTSALAVFVDVDHYIIYVYKKKDISLLNAWNYCSKIHDDSARTIFHQWPGVLFMILVCTFVYFYSQSWFWIIFIAYFSHRLLDYIPIENSIKVIKFSIFDFFFQFAKEEALFDIALIVILSFELLW